MKVGTNLNVTYNYLAHLEQSPGDNRKGKHFKVNANLTVKLILQNNSK